MTTTDTDPSPPSRLIPRHPPPRSAKAKPSASRFLALGVLALLGAVAGFLSARYASDVLLPLPGNKAWKFLVLGCIPGVWLFAVGVHELGHLVGGWLVGGRFLLWVVGPFKIQRAPAGIRWGLNRSVNLAGGMAACLPLEPHKLTPRNTTVMILGGPVASLMLASLAWAAAVWLGELPGAVGTGQAVLHHLAMATALLSALILVVTVVPSQAGGFKSDGKRAIDLLSGGERRSRQEQAVLILSLASMAGQRPAHFDDKLVDDALSLKDGSLFDLYAHLAVYYRAADRGEWAAAQRHLDTVLAGEAKVVPYAAAVARCEYAWLMATAGADSSAARAWLESAGSLDFDPATRLRAEAVVLLAEGRKPEAARAAEDGIEALHRRSLSPVAGPFAREALERIRDGTKGAEPAPGC